MIMKRNYSHILPKSETLIVSLASVVTRLGDLRYCVTIELGDGRTSYQFEAMTSAIDFIKSNFS